MQIFLPLLALIFVALPGLLLAQDSSGDDSGFPRWVWLLLLAAFLVAIALFSPRFIRVRIGLGIITIIGAVFIILLLLNSGALPDPAAGEKGDSAEMREQIRALYYLDRPLLERMYLQVKGMVWDGELLSYQARSINVVEEFWDKFPATIELALLALLIAIIVGMLLGILASVYTNTLADYGAMIVSLLGVSVPVFWLAIMLVWLFSNQLGWFPGLSRLSPMDSTAFQSVTGLHLIDTLIAGRPDLFVSALHHLALPALALATIPLAMIARMTRSSMLEVLGEDYIRTARAKGLAQPRVIFIHALRNASIPIVTLIGLQLGSLFAGAVLTETIFSWPGIGKWIFDGIRESDHPRVLVGVTMVVIVFVIINILVDLAYAWLNPRIRH